MLSQKQICMNYKCFSSITKKPKFHHKISIQQSMNCLAQERRIQLKTCLIICEVIGQPTHFSSLLTLHIHKDSLDVPCVLHLSLLCCQLHALEFAVCFCQLCWLCDYGQIPTEISCVSHCLPPCSQCSTLYGLMDLHCMILIVILECRICLEATIC